MLLPAPPPFTDPTIFSVPEDENVTIELLEPPVWFKVDATIADDPGPRLGVVITEVVVPPWTTPLVFVQVKLHPLSSENVPPTTIPVPVALLIACTVRESLTKTVFPLANATSPGPGTTPPNHVAGRLKLLFDKIARMSAIGYTFALMNSWAAASRDARNRARAMSPC
jgi:hypothetical protein